MSALETPATSVIPRSPEPSRRRRLILGLLTMTIGGILALGIGEIVVRLLLPQVEVEQWFESNARYGHTLKANFRQDYHYREAGIVVRVETNALGLRDREYDLSRTDVARVLLIGDSFTFGEGLDVDHIFDAKLESLLSQGARTHYVINTGVGGWGTLQETLYARDHFELFRPDIVVLTFCGNDPDDDDSFLRGARDNERGRFYFPGKIFIRNHSQLYGFLYRGFETFAHQRRIREKQRAHPELAIDPQSSTLISEDAWRRTLERIRAFQADFQRFNPNGVLLVQATYPMNPDIRSHLSTLSDGKRCLYVDLFEGARRLGPGNLRLPYDGHWTEAMHSVSARALYEAIVEAETRASLPRPNSPSH